MLIKASKACGHWDATDDMAMLVGENAAQALTSLKRRVLMTAVASPTFTTDRGYAFNGTTQYIDTGFVPSTMATKMDPSNIRLAVYERANVGVSSTIGIGVTQSGVSTISMNPRNATTTMTSNLGAGNVNFTIAADSRGLSVISRAGGGTAQKGWKNGVALTDGVAGAQNTALPSISLYIAARNNTGVADQFRASTVGYADWGAPLSSTAVELAWYTALQAFLTAVGANV
jgi:hypothetical protein